MQVPIQKAKADRKIDTIITIKAQSGTCPSAAILFWLTSLIDCSMT